MTLTQPLSQTQETDYKGWTLVASCAEMRESGRSVRYVARCVATRRAVGDLGSLPGPAEIVAETNEITAGGYESAAAALDTAIRRTKTKIDEATQ